jgi:hypothetical protein
MEKIESLQEFYKRKFDQVPGIVSGEIGHFNLLIMYPLTLLNTIKTLIIGREPKFLFDACFEN